MTKKKDVQTEINTEIRFLACLRRYYKTEFNRKFDFLIHQKIDIQGFCSWKLENFLESQSFTQSWPFENLQKFIPILPRKQWNTWTILVKNSALKRHNLFIQK